MAIVEGSGRVCRRDFDVSVKSDKEIFPLGPQDTQPARESNASRGISIEQNPASGENSRFSIASVS
jgi:hypothetical protein